MGSLTSWPHSLQNLLPSGFTFPHSGQAISNLFPHSLQNLAPFGLSIWHFGHLISNNPPMNYPRIKRLSGIINKSLFGRHHRDLFRFYYLPPCTNEKPVPSFRRTGPPQLPLRPISSRSSKGVSTHISRSIDQVNLFGNFFRQGAEMFIPS